MTIPSAPSENVYPPVQHPGLPVTPTSALYAALARAQGEIPEVQRDKKVKVKTKQGYIYEFWYAPLETIIKAVRPALTKNGLWFHQVLTEGGTEIAGSKLNNSGKLYLRTTIVHKDGGVIFGDTPIILPKGQDVETSTNQELGSAITYARRYGLSAILGIASEEDDDANLVDGNEITEHKRAKPREPKPAAAAPPAQQQQQAPEKQPSNAEAKYKNWAKRVCQKVRDAKTLVQLTASLKNEEMNMKRCEKQAPEIYETLINYIQEHQSKLEEQEGDEAQKETAAE